MIGEWGLENRIWKQGAKFMKRQFLLIMIAVIAAEMIFAAEPEFSGVFDSTANYTLGAGDAQEHSFGIEEFANLRLRMRTGDRASFFSSFNFIALSGNFLENADNAAEYRNSLLQTPFVNGQNYSAAVELERLYFRVNGNYIDTEMGLLRIPFGYGDIWGSTDFLNPKNPLLLNARPRAVLGMNFSCYPVDSLKLMAFAAAPQDPLETEGYGFLSGISLDQHWDRVSLQALYSYEAPRYYDDNDFIDSDFGIHRFGLSFKSDMELGLVADILYTLNPVNLEGIEGLSTALGFDYSFLGGDLFILMQYLVSGYASSTAFGYGGSWRNKHYLYETVRYRFTDFFSISLSMVNCFDDYSFTPFAALEYEFFQGFSANLTARIPLDQSIMNGGREGELGPLPLHLEGTPQEQGARFILNAGVRLRF